MLSLHNGACATPVYVLFDTGADPAWIRYGEHDNSDSMTMGL